VVTKKYFKKIPRLLIPIVTVLGILTVSIAVILYGRGYRFSFQQKPQISSTGLVSATSDPAGAQVIIDGILKTATNNSFNIMPGWYTVTISKEGYIPWQKKLRIQGEVVTQADAFLFPKTPSLSPLTSFGIVNPTLSPDGTKIAYIIPYIPGVTEGPQLKNTGLWVYELVDRPLGFNRDQRQVASYDSVFGFTDAKLTWSADSMQILAYDGSSYRLYQTNKLNDYTNVTSTVETIQEQWQQETEKRNLQKLASFKQTFVDIATSSGILIGFSPDETKVLYEATASATLPRIIIPPLIGANPTEEERTIKPGRYYVYDAKEDKNYFLLETKELKPLTTPLPSERTQGKPTPRNSQPTTLNQLQTPPIHWFPTNRHLVILLPGKVDILEYDRTNWTTVYAGPFSDGFLAPWPNGSRIILMTNLNPGVNNLPNLYTVNLR